jgi:HTH-type transcriptional regulator/antitoxin HigA
MANELKPIRSEPDYDEALREVERLWGEKSGTPKGDRLDVLITLIEAYEHEHHPMPLGAPDPIDAIKFRMEQQGLTHKDLQPLIGSRTQVAEVLARKRRLTLPMIRRLHAKLGIPAEVLVQPTKIGSSARPRRKAAACRS